MKILIPSVFAFILLLVSPFLGYSQSDSTQSDSTSVGEEMEYLEPEASSANLKMITPPDGFEVAEQFNGYIHFKSGSAIIMTLIKDATYITISKGMTEDFFRENKLTYISERKVITDNGTKGMDYKFSFVVQEVDFIRHMVYVGDLNQTLWLAITYPKMAEDLVEGEMLKAIQTINLNPSEDEE